MLRDLLGGFDPEAPPFLEPPFACDYGYNITVREGRSAGGRGWGRVAGRAEGAEECPSPQRASPSHPRSVSRRPVSQVGSSFYCNFNCVILDCGEVRIGDRVMFGPAVQVYAGACVCVCCVCVLRR